MPTDRSETSGNAREKWTTFSDHTGPTKRNGSYHFLFLFQIHYVSEEKYGNEPACQNGTANFGRTVQSGPPPDVVPNVPVKVSRFKALNLTEMIP